MSQENVKPDQIQASVAAALSRLRGDLSPPSDAPADAPAAAMPPAQPANDLRAEPGFKPIPSGVNPQASMDPPPAEPELPRAMFSRPRFVPPATPDAPPLAPTVQRTSGPLSRIMNKEPAPDAPAEPTIMSTATSTAASGAMPGASTPIPSALGAATTTGQEQPDLLAGLPPPPLGDALTEDTEAAMQRRRRNRRILALSAALVIVGAGFWFWNMGGGGSTDVPVIAAETTPEKVKPADEGGLQVPNQNVQVLDNMDTTQPAAEGETVLPPPEQPVTPPAPTIEETQQAPEAATDDNATATLQDVPSVTAPEPPATETTASEPAAPAAETTQPSAPETAPSATAAAEPEQQPAAPAPEAAAPEATQTQPAQTEPAQAEPAAPEPAATQEAAIAPAPAPATGDARIQLAAVKSEDAAQKEWAKLQKAFPDLLGSLTLTVQKVDKGASGIFYRIQAGPLADKAAAKKLCGSLKQRGQDCLVAK